MPHILLIDDETMITDPLARALREAGFTVDVAHDGASGLEMGLKANPDLVVLDVMLPGMDGWQLCQALRRQSNVPILMLTALGEEARRLTLKKAHAYMLLKWRGHAIPSLETLEKPQ